MSKKKTLKVVRYHNYSLVIPYFNSLDSWNFDTKTGEWEVAPDNNFARNGSFEADRKQMPSQVKPVQTFVMGWKTTVIEGNAISLDSTSSPVLNYANTEEDRKTVIGERSLNIEDKVDFRQDVSQVISSSPYVKLPDGLYTLSAKIKNTSGFKDLQMYAESSGKRLSHKVEKENSQWETITFKRISVKRGKVKIGFEAEANAGASCQIDDVSLVREP